MPVALPLGESRDEARCVRALLAPGAVAAHFQPIVRLEDSHVLGYEALARPQLAPLEAPERFLAAARRARLRSEAELACWRAAAAVGPPPEDRLLFLNVSPAALANPGFPVLAELVLPRVVIELTERDSVEDLAELREVLAPWTRKGAMLALDDVGGGFASLESIIELRPQFIKVSRRLVRGIDHDRRRRSLLAFVANYARESRVTLVAEGVETAEELAVLRALGVEYAQGFLIARPGPPWPEVARLPAGSSRLTRRLDDDARAPSPRDRGSVTEACQAVVERFERDLLLPSVYLERGGVLRCQALSGYWQLLDGIPPDTGVIGTTFASGRTTVLADVEDSVSYLEAAPEVRAEACVPIRSGDRVVGVLNVESPMALPEGLVDEMHEAADALGRRLAELGGTMRDSRAALLARHAAALAGLVEDREIARRVVEAARDVSGLSSAAVARSDADGGLVVVAADGPLAPTFAGLTPLTLTRMVGWVQGVRSSYTLDAHDGRGFGGHELLRAAGAEALAVLPLEGPSGRTGILVLADEQPASLDTGDMELLELLAAQASSCLSTAAAVTALSQQAASDPLTGLGHQATFRAALLEARRNAAHETRVGVILIDIDGFKSINDTRGHLAGDQILRSVAGALSGALRSSDRLYRVGGDEFAAIVQVSSADEAHGVARRLVGAVRRMGEVTVSVGAALADVAESDAALFARADGALYAVKRRGRDDVELAAPPQSATAPPGQAQLWS